jgi:hypothetical protein
LHVASESQCPVRIGLLLASPPDRVSHAFHVEFRFEPETFPLRTLRQRELGLPNLAGQRVSQVDPACWDSVKWMFQLESSKRTFREVALGYEGETLQRMPDRLIPAGFDSFLLPYSSFFRPKAGLHRALLVKRA